MISNTHYNFSKKSVTAWSHNPTNSDTIFSVLSCLVYNTFLGVMPTQGQGQSTKTDGQTTGTRVRGMTSQRKGGVRLDLSYCWERQREKDGESERAERGSWCLFTQRASAFFYRLRPTDPNTGGRQRLTGRPSLM
jgi:hypothetical protein